VPSLTSSFFSGGDDAAACGVRRDFSVVIGTQSVSVGGRPSTRRGVANPVGETLRSASLNTVEMLTGVVVELCNRHDGDGGHTAMG